MRVLSDLWYGNISPHERSIQPNSKYKRLLKLLSDLGEQIRSAVSPEQAKLIDEYESIYATIIAQNEEDAFTIGFRLCAKIMFEVLEHNPSA